MKMKNILKAAEVAAGTGLYLLGQSERFSPRVRKQIGHQFGDLVDRAKEGYEVAADRVSHVSKSLRRNGNHRTTATAIKFAAGIGIGVAVGLLMAPAKGRQTRRRLSEKAQEIAGHVRQHVMSNGPSANFSDEQRTSRPYSHISDCA